MSILKQVSSAVQGGAPAMPSLDAEQPAGAAVVGAVALKAVAASPAPPPSAAGLIAALGKPLEPVAAKTNAAGLIAALGQPLPADLAASKKKAHDVMVNAQAKGQKRLDFQFSAEESLLLCQICARCPGFDFLSLGNLLCLDIYLNLKEVRRKYGETYSRGLVEAFAGVVIILNLALTREITERFFANFSPKHKFNFSAFPTIEGTLDRLRVTEEALKEMIHNLSDHNQLVFKPGERRKKGATLESSSLKNKEKMLASIRPHIDAINGAIQLLRKSLGAIGRADYLNLVGVREYLADKSALPDLRVVIKNRGFCFEHLVALADMFNEGLKGSTSSGLKSNASSSLNLNELCKNLKRVVRDIENWDLVADFNAFVHRQVVEFSWQANNRYDLFIKTLDANGAAESTPPTKFKPSYNIAQDFGLNYLVTKFYLNFQMMFDVLLIEPAFPGYVSQTIHYIKIWDRFTEFYKIIVMNKAKANPSGKSAVACQSDLIIGSFIVTAEKHYKDFLPALRAILSSFNKMTIDFNYFMFAKHAEMLGILVAVLKGILPLLNEQREKLLKAIEDALRALPLEELLLNREGIRDELLPINSPDVHDLCRFILFVKRIEGFMTVMHPDKTQGVQAFVPDELIDYLNLEGIEELIDLIIAEKMPPQEEPKLDAEPPPPAAAKAATAKAPKKEAPQPSAAAAPKAATVKASADKPVKEEAPQLKIRAGEKLRRVQKLLETMGYETVRQTGSHIVLNRFFNGEERTVVLPRHEHLKPGTAHSIAKQVNG